MKGLNTSRESEMKRGKKTTKKKDGLGPVMVSDTLCPAVQIVGT